MREFLMAEVIIRRSVTERLSIHPARYFELLNRTEGSDAATMRSLTELRHLKNRSGYVRLRNLAATSRYGTHSVR